MDHVVVAPLLVLLAVVVGGWIARASGGRVPLPLVQIGVGGLLAATTDLGLGLDPEIFFLFFLPPLLFLDGWRIPKDGLAEKLGLVLELSLGLVVASVLAVGLLLHWMIPDMPLAVAFALAAVLSPTDPVAIGAVLARQRMPRHLEHVLEGESLLNDVSGLVCMRFAVAAVLTGHFSPAEAGTTSLWLAAVGVGTGVAVTLAVTSLEDRISLRIGEEPGSKILVSLILPFGAYLLAERLDGSGVLAAVVAGVVLAWTERSERGLPVTRVRRAAVWDMVRLALNGAMFVVVGEQLPAIVASATVALRANDDSPLLIPVHIVAVTLAFIALRVVWLRASHLLRRRRPAGEGRLVWVAGFSGVRGSITIAGALSLPLTANGGAFPARDIAIVIATGAVVLSLVLATLVLPLLLQRLGPSEDDALDRRPWHAQRAAAEAAVAAIEATLGREHALSSKVFGWREAGARIAAEYANRIDGLSRFADQPEELRRARTIDRTLRIAALQAERRTYRRLFAEHRLPEEEAHRLAAEIDRLETRLTDPTP